MTDADVFRKAAALMRERARAATPGPWGNHGGPGEDVVRTETGAPLARTGTRADRRHIASWDPGVALTVADWLDQHARYHNLPCKLDGCGALAVATAYLGGDT